MKGKTAITLMLMCLLLASTFACGEGGTPTPEAGAYLTFEADCQWVDGPCSTTMAEMTAVLRDRIYPYGIDPVIEVVPPDRITVFLPGVMSTDEALEMIGNTQQLILREREHADWDEWWGRRGWEWSHQSDPWQWWECSDWKWWEEWEQGEWTVAEATGLDGRTRPFTGACIEGCHASVVSLSGAWVGSVHIEPSQEGEHLWDQIARRNRVGYGYRVQLYVQGSTYFPIYAVNGRMYMDTLSFDIAFDSLDSAEEACECIMEAVLPLSLNYVEGHVYP